MTRTKRMQPVQKVAQSREQAAVQELGQSQQSLDAQQAKLEELRALPQLLYGSLLAALRDPLNGLHAFGSCH